jgi:hypothetical protein
VQERRGEVVLESMARSPPLSVPNFRFLSVETSVSVSIFAA